MSDTVRVLHVDDDASFGEVTAELLEREADRFEVEVVTSASEGLAKLDEHAEAFDCVVSDYDMPGMDGVDFLRAVRKDFPDLPFILFTGKGSEEVASDAIAAGATDYLQKRAGTGQYDLLANRIRNAVDTFRTKREREQTIERVTDAIIKVDADWTVTFVDDRARELYREYTADFLGRDFFDIFPKDRGTTYETEYRAVMDSREPTAFEAESTVLDLWFEIEVYPDDDGGISIYFHDITDRKERELQLEATRERMEFALDATNSIIYEIDLESGVETRHGPFEQLYGIESEQLPTSEDFYEHGVHPEDRAKVRRLEQVETLRERAAPVEFEYRTHPDHGEGRWLRTRSYLREGSEADARRIVGLATDITERKAREREVADERDRYATLFENLPNPVVYGKAEDGAPIVQSVNPAFEETFGVDADEVEGKNLQDLIVPSDHQAAATELSQEVLQGGQLQTEVRRETADGTRTFRLDVALRNPDGARPEGYAIYTDIADWKDHERRLASLHEVTRDLLEAETPAEVARIASEATDDVLGHLMNGIHFYDEKAGALEPVAVSDATTAVLDSPPALDEGLAWNAFQDGEFRVYDDVRGAADTYNEETPMRSEMYLPLGEHGLVIISSTEVAAFDERDVTLAKTLAANVRSALDRLGHERRLARERDRLSALFEAIPQPVAHTRLVDGEPILQQVNSSFEEVFGYSSDEAVGESIDDLIVPDRYLDEARDINRQVASTSGVETVVTRETVDGERDFLFSTRNMADGESTEVLGIYADITEQKQREEQLERKNERLDQFTSVVSHDLQSPLTTVELSLELARDTGDPAHFARCERAVDRMQRLLDDLLTLARQGEMVDEMRGVTLSETVEACWRTLETGDADLVVASDCAFMADEGRLRQLLANLFRNAVNHGSTSDPTASDDAAHGEGVTVTVGTLAEGTGFYVADDGPGIPVEDRDDVFEHGYSTSQEGTGFGLAIVEDIADAHGWDVRVTESEDGGARFEITGVEQPS